MREGKVKMLLTIVQPSDCWFKIHRCIIHGHRPQISIAKFDLH